MTDQDIIRTLKRAGFTIRYNHSLGAGEREIGAVRRDTLNVVGAQVTVTTPTVYLPPEGYAQETFADVKVQGRKTERWWGWNDIAERIGRI